VIDIPEVIRRQAVAVGADDWLANLDNVVAELASSWNITVGTTFPNATEAYVAEAVTDSGELLVLKIHIPREGGFAQSEITALRIADGDGCALLVDHDVTLGALLLERLGPSLHDLALPIDRRHEILCGVAKRMWRPAPDCGLPNGRQKVRAQMESIRSTWEELNHPAANEQLTTRSSAARGALPPTTTKEPSSFTEIFTNGTPFRPRIDSSWSILTVEWPKPSLIWVSLCEKTLSNSLKTIPRIVHDSFPRVAVSIWKRFGNGERYNGFGTVFCVARMIYNLPGDKCSMLPKYALNEILDRLH